jgi:hypothetical protein
VTAGRAAGLMTLLLIWTVLVTFVWPILRDDRLAARRKRRFEQLIPQQPWQRPTSPAVRVLPPPTAAASRIPPLVAAPAALPSQRRIS